MQGAFLKPFQSLLQLSLGFLPIKIDYNERITAKSKHQQYLVLYCFFLDNILIIEFSWNYQKFYFRTLADISAALFWRAKCCVKAARVAPLATPAKWQHNSTKRSSELRSNKGQIKDNMIYFVSIAYWIIVLTINGDWWFKFNVT